MGERKDMKEKIKGDGTSARPRGREEQTVRVNPLKKRGEETEGGDEGGGRGKHRLIAVLLKR